MWVYKSPIGTMVIRKTNLGYALIINGEIYEYHDSAISAADNVYMHVTGCFDWDILDGEIDTVPTDIHEWERI